MAHPSPPTSVLAFDTAPAAVALDWLRPVCASDRWLQQVVSGRPYGSVAALVATGEQAVAGLAWADVEPALAEHPRIGERAEGADPGSSWSRQEQSAAGKADEAVRAELRAGNLAYEQRFGFVFLIAASGRSAEDMLAALQTRLHNDQMSEREVVRDQLRAIVGLRLGQAFR